MAKEDLQKIHNTANHLFALMNKCHLRRLFNRHLAALHIVVGTLHHQLALLNLFCHMGASLYSLCLHMGVMTDCSIEAICLSYIFCNIAADCAKQLAYTAMLFLTSGYRAGNAATRESEQPTTAANGA